VRTAYREGHGLTSVTETVDRLLSKPVAAQYLNIFLYNNNNNNNKQAFQNAQLTDKISTQND